MTPITNISIAPSTNVIMTTPQPPLIYTPSGLRQKKPADRQMTKPPSSTLVDLLKQRRSPPPPPPPPPLPPVKNNSLSITTRQQKSNSIIKQPKKPSKKSQIQTKRLSVNHENNIRVNLNNLFQD